ncbi:putative lipid II flippase FtsW [Halalkalibacterium ligniniphilum]|uniref:putative lipid II flippase FtsW n=1 Tax=Halalkalibacterium ligniniphilum TaxID=1134413 RepID=UPI00034A3428|nr:putative lipid II flippase FtsW [Halalkalibacterium ligniniphilum]
MNYSFIKDNDWLLIITTLLLASFGLLMVFSSSYVTALYEAGNLYHYAQRQLIWLILSLLAFLFFMHFPYRFYKKLAPLILFFCVVSLILVKVPGIGVSGGGAERWIGIGPFTVQPSEFVKLGMIIYLASVYSQKQAYIDQFVKGVMPPLIVVGVIFTLIMLQPDLGTATAILILTILIVFFSGAKWRHLVGLAIVGLSLFIVFATSASYRMERLTSFMDPFSDPYGSGLQLVQSYIAIAHGGLTGAGLGQSVQKLLYLPEPHTDFILAIIAEELGFLGVGFVLFSYGFILFRGVAIGTRCKNPFGSLLAFGIVFQIAIQVVFNVGAVTGLLPITGIPLPLVSNGGSSLLVTLISIAILANIARHNIRQRKGKMKEERSLQAS